METDSNTCFLSEKQEDYANQHFIGLFTRGKPFPMIVHNYPVKKTCQYWEIRFIVMVFSQSELFSAYFTVSMLEIRFLAITSSRLPE